MTRSSNKPKSSRRTATRKHDPIPWRYCILTFGCGTLLAVGFFFAARMHFSAIDYGMRNAKLRRQKENLEAEQRRFVVAKETAMSPQALNKAARKIGLEEMSFESNSIAQDLSSEVSPSEKESAVNREDIKKPTQTFAGQASLGTKNESFGLSKKVTAQTN